MKLLIPTGPNDSHAIFVKLALEKMGHRVRLLFTADQPTQQKNSVYINNNSYEWKSADKYDSVSDNAYDVVWWRWGQKPFLPKDTINPDDYKFVIRENTLFHDSLTNNMAPDAWWINPKEAAARASSKLLQLKTASSCGLVIPSTLCSNDPKDIRYFLLRHETQGVIYKPFCSSILPEASAANNAKIGFLDLPSNKLLQLVPGIYQKEIKKKYALRITCFGDYLLAAKLNAPSFSDLNNVESYTLPVDFANKVRAFMHKMGLVFASLDFIVGWDGEYIFQEINEREQFLWIEEENTEFPMLDIFIQFILNKSSQFEYDSQKHQHNIEDYHREVEEILSQNTQFHVDLNHLPQPRSVFQLIDY